MEGPQQHGVVVGTSKAFVVQVWSLAKQREVKQKGKKQSSSI